MVSCLQEPTTSNFGDFSNDVTEENLNDPNDTVDVNVTLSWFENRLHTKTLTRAQNTNKISYLFGDDLHNYLTNRENYNSKFCMIAKFTTTNSNVVEYRVKLTPSFLVDFTTGQRSYYLRVSTSSATGNDFCNLPIQSNAADGSIILTSPQTTIANYSDEICSDCNNDLTSTDINIYQANTDDTAISLVDNNFLNYDDLRLIIQISETNTNGNTTSSTCSNTSCSADGFDCCINNQCVNNRATIRSENLLTPDELADFQLAESQRETNPNWYLQYPNFYYICPNLVDVSNSENDDDNVTDNSENINQRILDYLCVQEMQTYSEVDPFHDFPINSNHTYTRCDTSNDETETMHYKNVLSRLYDNCGCDDQYTTLSEQIEHCPNYTYTPEFAANSSESNIANITNIQCHTPPVESNTPITQIVDISNKSAPHRYFNSDGIEIDLDNNPDRIENKEQEGDPFLYLDTNFVLPQNGSFNMNSILGSMSINLSGAIPAKKIAVKTGQKYFLETTQGFYSPCPTCARDSWSSQLFANPSSGQGFGVQSIGYTTKRYQAGTNTSFANYSDNHFGRACFVPPTMLPFTHKTFSSSSTQRRNRLKAQAALYVNGYQKDWFGFNKGALIGSFDGVTWFPIGNGRIVTSSSNFLYLAINAPYADLAIPSTHKVLVQEWDGISIASRYDYDPSKTLNSPFQNQGATCQENYLCESDSDCITKLGWEYNCQDVSTYKTKWPQFNSTTSTENANIERVGNIHEFLQQGVMPPGATKRCVYKGAGSVCRTDADTLSSGNLRRQLTCAPNFYCANLNTPGVFNKEIARFGAPLESLTESNNHYFGKDANQLGRPKHYIPDGNGASLSSSIRQTITENVLLMDSTAAGKIGLCMPGRALPTENGNSVSNIRPEETHDKSDPEKRTDYISQVAGCNSTIFNLIKYNSCPSLDVDGNFISLGDNYHASNAIEREGLLRASALQNSCGFESLRQDTNLVSNLPESTLRNYSAFSSIESLPLNETPIITTQTLAANACLRRAGAVCHTDLDCSPNILHANLIDIINPTFFGNEAEKNYWSEDLICGQGIIEPNISSPNFNSYDITNNRCCREIGKELTIYTEDPNSDLDIKVNPRMFSSINPNEPTRYSRYSILGELVEEVDSNSTSFVSPSASTSINDINRSTKSSITTHYQWKTINEVASQTCCGGGWVRKFADGTNDWSVNRLNLNINNFRCLNSKSPLLNITEEDASKIDPSPNYYSKLSTDRNLYCQDSTGIAGNCTDLSFEDLRLGVSDSIRPILNSTTDEQETRTFIASNTNFWADNPFTFFTPVSALTSPTAVASLPYMDWTVDLTNISLFTRKIYIHIPTYIPLQTISTVTLSEADAECTQEAWLDSVRSSDRRDGQELSPWSNRSGQSIIIPESSPGAGNGVSGYTCRYAINPSSRTMTIAYDTTDLFEEEIHYASLRYTAPGTQKWQRDKEQNNERDTVHKRSSTPGEPLYYLEKLERLELIGIPQMTFEPLYCNDNYAKLMPGIFLDSYTDLDDIIEASPSIFFEDQMANSPWDNSGLTTNEETLNKAYVTTKDQLNHPEIFSSDEVMCCTPLGREANSSAQCCSGLAVRDQSTNRLLCKIPTGVDLNVYFNRYISNEGTNSEIESTRLTNDDFDSRTGAPKNTTTVISKLIGLGESHCENENVRRGGAFGNFSPQPNDTINQGNSTRFNIVDSFNDRSSNGPESRGAEAFNAGFRWNHHVYCDFPETN